MKYEKEIKELLHDIFFESWMGVSDYEELITEIFRIKGTSYEQLSNEIEIGVNNGVSAEQQIALIKILIKPYTKK